MFRRLSPRRALQAAATPTRQFSLGSVSSSLYNNVWRKSNMLYISYIVIGCVAFESIYGSLTNFVWDSYNYGKLYKQVDWSKFKSEDDEDEDDE